MVGQFALEYLNKNSFHASTKSWNVKKTMVGQFALEYLNNNSFHAGNVNYVLHKTTIANKLNHAETRTSVLKYK